MKKPDERGISAVEFALLLPLLVLILFGIIEFGLLLYDQALITNASREGARAGAMFATTRLTKDQVKDLVKKKLSIDPTNFSKGWNLISFASANPVPYVASGTPGAMVNDAVCPNTTPASCLTDTTTCPVMKVTVTYQYTSLVLGTLAGRNLTASTTMRCE